jgi:hypothetical protein
VPVLEFVSEGIRTVATADQIKALLQSHVTGDDDRFYSIALQVAATEARQGHANLARELRDMVDEARQKARATLPLTPTPVAQPIEGWWGAMGAPAVGTKLGVVDLVVDEQGHVADAYIYTSVNRVYDAVLLASVKHWQFQPAMRGGRAVKYRRLSGVVSQR